MRDRGYDYACGEDPVLKFSDRPEISTAEIDTRIADLECDSQVGITRARSEAEEEPIADWADANATRIAEIDELNQQVLDHLANRAARLHRKGSTPSTTDECGSTEFGEFARSSRRPDRRPCGQCALRRAALPLELLVPHGASHPEELVAVAARSVGLPTIFGSELTLARRRCQRRLIRARGSGT